MTDVLHHGFTSPRGDGADPTQIQPSHWNTGHKFQGGVAGDLLIRDPTDANYGAKWRAGVAVVFPSTTGPVNDWAPGLVGNTFIQWIGSGALTVTGLAGGVVGQTVTIANYGNGAAISLVDQSASSLAANRFRLLVTSAPTPIAFGGWATFIYNGAVWVLVAYEQGAWITPAYSAANFTAQAGTWTVEAGDVQTYAYRLTGRQLTVAFFLASTSLSAVASDLRIAIPGGFLSTKVIQTLIHARDAGGAYAVALARVTGGGVIYLWSTVVFGTWAVSAGVTDTIGEITFEVS